MRPVLVLGLALLATACTGSGTVPTTSGPASTPAPAAGAPPTATTPPPPDTTPPPTTVPPTSSTPTSSSPSTAARSAHARPAWLGTRVLEEREDGTVAPQPTPPELVDRRFETFDLLTPPDGDEFEFTSGPVPADVLARSSWSPECPVAAEELAYLTMSHYGFDGRLHTGEMIVNAAVADDVVEVFRALHQARFPIEQMRVIRADEIDAPPTGDGNETTSFVCRPAVGTTNWSQHAYGLAIDVNPFHNPYLKGERVLPELAAAYLDRANVRPGMILPGDPVTEAFAAIGWGWGGEWRTLDDWMHFSRNGR